MFILQLRDNKTANTFCSILIKMQ